MHIISIDPVNPRNLDAGSFLFMRDSRVYETLEPSYELQLKVDEVANRFSGTIMVSFLAEYMTQQESKPKQVRKA